MNCSSSESKSESEMKRTISGLLLAGLPAWALSQSPPLAKAGVTAAGVAPQAIFEVNAAAAHTTAAELKNVIVSVPAPKGARVGQVVTNGQVIPPSLAEGGTESEMLLVLPKHAPGQKLETTETPKDAKANEGYAWAKQNGHPLLQYNGRNVLEFMNDKHDTSTPLSHYLTFKLFHHVYDPVEGKTLLTAGAHDKDEKIDKDGKKVNKYTFPHHRGLFYGFNRIAYEPKKTADIWHGNKNEFASFEGVVSEAAGPFVGRHRIKIDWHGQDGEVFAKEERELSAYAITGGHMIDFVSLLKTDKPKVRLDGDPQHAGFHMRASQEVAQSTAGETYYLRTDGKGEKKQTRNWDPKTKKGPVNLPWNAMSFVVGGKRYTAVYLDHPKNPKEARYSERDYGRFGSYFEYDLTPKNPLLVRYRLWIQPGEMTVEACQALYESFVYELPKAH
jgi:hypothetical protein